MRRGVGSNQHGDKLARAETPTERAARIVAAIAAARSAQTPRPTIAREKSALTREQMGAMVAVLERHGVEYVVIGGCAVSSYDEEVMQTEDLDMMLKRESGNLARAAAALRDLGAEIRNDDGTTTALSGPFDQGIFAPYLGGMLSTSTRYGPIDFVISMKGFPRTYEDLQGRSSRREVAGVMSTVCDLDAIIESKEGAERAKDLRVLPLLRALLRRTDLDNPRP